MRAPRFSEGLFYAGMASVLVFAVVLIVLLIYGPYVAGSSPDHSNQLTGEVVPLRLVLATSYVTEAHGLRLLALTYIAEISFLVSLALDGAAWLAGRPATALRPTGTAKGPLLQGLFALLLGAIIIAGALIQTMQHRMVLVLFGVTLIAIGGKGVCRALALRR